MSQQIMKKRPKPWIITLTLYIISLGNVKWAQSVEICGPLRSYHTGGLSIWDGGGVRGRPLEGGLDGFTLDSQWVVAMKLGKEQDKVIH